MSTLPAYDSEATPRLVQEAFALRRRDPELRERLHVMKSHTIRRFAVEYSSEHGAKYFIKPDGMVTRVPDGTPVEVSVDRPNLENTLGVPDLAFLLINEPARPQPSVQNGLPCPSLLEVA